MILLSGSLQWWGWELEPRGARTKGRRDGAGCVDFQVCFSEGDSATSKGNTHKHSWILFQRQKLTGLKKWSWDWIRTTTFSAHNCATGENSELSFLYGIILNMLILWCSCFVTLQINAKKLNCKENGWHFLGWCFNVGSYSFFIFRSAMYPKANNC